MRTSRWRSRASRDPVAAPRPSRSATCAGRCRPPTGARSTWTGGSRATAPRGATAPPRSRCTSSGGCSVASKRRPDEAPPAPRARLFVALDLRPEMRAALVEWQAHGPAGRGRLRAVPPDALHVTLAFLGHRPVAEVEPITATLERAVTDLEKPARLRATEARGVPPRRPRLFAL